MSDVVRATSGPLTRREFSLQAALALLSTCVITVSDCGGNKTPTQPTPTDVQGVISNNHPQPHTATITGAQIIAGQAIQLHIQGQASHDHTVDVSQADLSTLRNRQQVAKTSSTDANHSHTVTFTPA